MTRPGFLKRGTHDEISINQQKLVTVQFFLFINFSSAKVEAVLRQIFRLVNPPKGIFSFHTKEVFFRRLWHQPMFLRLCSTFNFSSFFDKFINFHFFDWSLDEMGRYRVTTLERDKKTTFEINNFLLSNKNRGKIKKHFIGRWWPSESRTSFRRFLRRRPFLRRFHSLQSSGSNPPVF